MEGRDERPLLRSIPDKRLKWREANMSALERLSSMNDPAEPGAYSPRMLLNEIE